MATFLQTCTASLLIVIALPVAAGHKDNRYPGPAYGGSQYDYARVIDVEPVIEFVRIPEDHQLCREVPVQRRVAEYRSPAPAIFGAIVGGIIGNQLSRGHGHKYRHGHDRAAATVAGAAIGGVIGSEIQYSKYPARYYTENTRVCGIETSWRREERVVAWDVSWKYRGRIYHSRMVEPPGKRIWIRVNVDTVYP